jgi:hypothetical protein
MKMKPAITITTSILSCVLGTGAILAQNPSIIQNTRSAMNGVSSQQTAASNQALGVQPSSIPAASPAHSATPHSAAPHAAVQSSAVGVKAVRVAKHPVRKPRGAAVLVSGATSSAPATALVPEAAPSVAGNSVASGVEGDNGPSEQSVVPDSKYAANGRRDPFISPVVSHASGSGCSTGKKCLEIGAINLRGVVHSEQGFIAVVSNGLNKAYFLRENDPVFNGYVVKITGDSIVFQETLQDRLGKSFTREVVKKITTPAV